MYSMSSLYIKNMKIYEPADKEKLGEFSVVLNPAEFSGMPSLCSIKLKVKYKRRYPKTSPIFKLEEIHGVTPTEVANIK